MEDSCPPAIGSLGPYAEAQHPDPGQEEAEDSNLVPAEPAEPPEKLEARPAQDSPGPEGHSSLWGQETRGCCF